MILGELKTTPQEWDKRFFLMATSVADWSKDPERQVGAVVVSPNRRRFSLGYNGFPRGVTDTKERLKSGDRLTLMVHAELNAILNAGCDLEGWTLYSTKCPCVECAKAIVQSRIVRVVSPSLDQQSSWFQSCSFGAGIMQEAGITLSVFQ